MTNEQAKSELMQLYGSLSEEKKQALDVLMAQADGEYISKDTLIEWLKEKDLIKMVGQEKEARKQLDELPSIDIPQDHDGCKDCRWQSQSETEMPCKQCMHNYTDEWERAKTGHWESIGEEYIQVYDIAGIPSRGDKRRCSECGFQKVFIGRHYNQYKFCPECGSPMKIER